MDAQKAQVKQGGAVWARVYDWRQVTESLGDLFAADRDRVAVEFTRGQAIAYQVAGADYDGEMLLRFVEDDGGALSCNVIAYRGRNVPAVMADLEKLLSQTEAETVTIETETAAHVRLYAAAGFTVERCEMKKRLRA